MSHKNIVDFVEAFEDDDNVYIILELCEKTVRGLGTSDALET